MSLETEQILSIILPIVIPFVSSVIIWFFNERSKRMHENYKRKEKRYLELIKSLKGFYVNSLDENLRGNFLDQLNQCWLYAPDDILKKAYEFLETVKTGEKKYSEEEKEKVLGELILALRKDLLTHKLPKRTNLTSKDFKNYSPNKDK